MSNIPGSRRRHDLLLGSDRALPIPQKRVCLQRRRACSRWRIKDIGQNMTWFLSVSVCLSPFLSLSLSSSVCLFVFLSLFVFVCLVFLSLFASVSVCLPVCLPFSLYLCLFVSLSFFVPVSIPFLSACLFVLSSLFVCLYPCQSVRLSL